MNCLRTLYAPKNKAIYYCYIWDLMGFYELVAFECLYIKTLGLRKKKPQRF